ncbi:MAG: exodeoxyribonuclease VII large subunit, partial [Alphaproteobacteria bacterium]|nr:exodeoxyribonuclease VII large subunit [Alphaproteobacteria bacterium]
PALRRLLARAADGLAAQGKLLGTLSHMGTLARGYALVRGSDGRLISHAVDVAPGEDVALVFADAMVGARITTPPTAPGRPRRALRQPRHGEQGTLF